MLPIPMKVKVALALVTVVGSFTAGWFVNGWRWDAKYTDRENKITEAALTASEDARETETASAAITAEVGTTGAARKAEEKVVERVITKEVIRYVKADYGGRIILPLGWVRLDTASATGDVPSSLFPALGPDDAPSGVTDADAIEVIAARNNICRAEIARLELWQVWWSKQCKLFYGNAKAECQLQR